MKPYICGPMSGYPDMNFPAFNEAAANLTTFGHEPQNPASYGDIAQPWEWNMKIAVGLLMGSDSMVLLPGWEGSKGAVIEYDLARKLKYPIYTYPNLERFRESAAQEGHRLTTTARQATYGLPEDDYKRTVGAFNALTGKDLTVAQGMLFMVCVKLSREAHQHTRDNLADGIGYLNCQDQMYTRQIPSDGFPEGLGCVTERKPV